MKNVILLSLFLLINNCSSQTKRDIISNKQIKKDTMQYFNAQEYQDWKIDPDFCSQKYPCKENDKFLMKDNLRMRITIDENKIYVVKRYYQKALEKITIFSKATNKILSNYDEFYLNPIGKVYEYNEAGHIFKETNWDAPYKFSVSDLVKKFKQEYNVDIENTKNVFKINRFEEKEYLHIPIYEVGLNTNSVSAWDFCLIDGNTGKTLYSTKIEEGDKKIPLEEYYKSLGHK